MAELWTGIRAGELIEYMLLRMTATMMSRAAIAIPLGLPSQLRRGRKEHNIVQTFWRVLSLSKGRI